MSRRQEDRKYCRGCRAAAFAFIIFRRLGVSRETLSFVLKVICKLGKYQTWDVCSGVIESNIVSRILRFSDDKTAILFGL